jgi:hypothetical protein
MATNGKTNGKRNGTTNMATNSKTNGKRNGTTKENGRAATEKERRALNTRWVYAYQLDPPQPEPKFKKINALVRQAQTAAKRGGHLWSGRIVVETLVTHLLIVTDDPQQAPGVNRAIETELKQHAMGFALTGPAALPLSTATRATRTRSSKSGDSRVAAPLEKLSMRR